MKIGLSSIKKRFIYFIGTLPNRLDHLTVFKHRQNHLNIKQRVTDFLLFGI
jgi:hypothetical protein